ncbi:MAG TPA: MerR family transcriptional regulator [Stellaceae bacterium]|jgi:DNA-binding transcriptional MerR regulator|nr:MerR family transcriptional regulator [Stellaceae bacterium]
MGDGEGARARPVKGASAFRTIGEVAEDLDLPAHVLRFWESKFPQLKPLKRGGGRRYYRPEDIALLQRIRQCLYQDGYTIRGVQRLLGDLAGESEARTLREAPPSLFPLEPAAASPEIPGEPRDAVPPRRARQRPPSPGIKAALEEIRRELVEARALLDALRRRGKKG